MGSWGHFENRSKAALGNKKARFHCARLHLLCSHVMRLYRTNLIINNLKERTNHGKTIETSLARDPNPLWRGRSQIHEENGDPCLFQETGRQKELQVATRLYALPYLHARQVYLR